MIDIEKLLAAQPTKTVPVESWGGDVTLRQLTIEGYAEIASEHERNSADGGSVNAGLPVYARVLAGVIIKPKASSGQWHAILRTSPVEVSMLVGEALELSNAKKNYSSKSGTD